MKNNIIIQDLEEIISFKKVVWKKFEGSNFLISGGQGMLGLYIVYTLIFLNNNVFKKKVNIYLIIRGKLNNKIKQLSKNNRLKIIRKDLREFKTFDKKIDYIIHAASNARPNKYIDNPVDTLDTNYNGTYNLLNLSLKKKIKSFLYLSSGDVYGNVKKKFISENEIGSIDLLSKRACYSEAKRIGETLCYNFHLKHRLPIKIVRLFHTYGPTLNLKDERIFSSIVKDLKNKKKIVINSNGKEKRSFCYITDAIIGFFLILQKGKDGNAYNLANNKENIKIIDLAKIISKIPKYSVKIIVKGKKKFLHQTSYTNHYKPLVTKLKKLGWVEKVNLKEGFSRIIKYLYE